PAAPRSASTESAAFRIRRRSRNCSKHVLWPARRPCGVFLAGSPRCADLSYTSRLDEPEEDLSDEEPHQGSEQLLLDRDRIRRGISRDRRYDELRPARDR